MILWLICFAGFLQFAHVAAKPTLIQSVDSTTSKEYKLYFYVQANWYSAYLFCRDNGMRLATINSQQEQDYLAEVIADTGLSAEWWTSGTDLGYEDRFSWNSSGSLFKYTNWDANQPDNAGGVEHCTTFRSNYKWNDAGCAAFLPFICETMSTSNEMVNNIPSLIET